MEHLIADSGIQFLTTEIEFNPSEPLLLGNGRTLKYSFCETVDIIEGTKVFDMLYNDSESGKFIPLTELTENDDAVVRRPNGREEFDECGIVVMKPGTDVTFFTTYSDSDEGIYTINSLQSYRVKDPKDGMTQLPAFEVLLNQWLPMPMFRTEVDGVTDSTPTGWCRAKMIRIGEGEKKGMERFRIIWAFDTELATEVFSTLRPYIDDTEDSYCMCNRADLLMGFLSTSDEFHAFADYIASLMGIDIKTNDSRKFKAYYIYFLNFLRLSGAAPEVTLHNNHHRQIPVDLVLDIGNSRTCGILFEEGEFTRGKMMEMRDMTNPWTVYENKTFDMRVVFRKADFGNDIVLDEEMFQWRSFVRIGDEARRLVYRSLEEEGFAEKTTNYSSPKRYLWDTKEYDGQWENLVTTEDPFNVMLTNDISISRLSELFDKTGSYKRPAADGTDGGMVDIFNIGVKEHHFSRASLMTFALLEIFNHALMEINSVKYREKWGNKDCRRNIRNIIITCPTAMPLSEQVRLRQYAADAFEAITRCTNNVQMANIIPQAETLKVTDPYADINKRVWAYDEASCCQLVYLYAEIAQRYKGEIHKFFELKGHVRPELKEEGYEGKALTIGTIDIGAGTTDVMVCAYKCQGRGEARLTPTPLFWDSFYLAGDDILRNLVQNLVIEGKEHTFATQGNITAALTARILQMTNEELRALPCLDNAVYRSKANDICSTVDEEERNRKKRAFASNLIHDFFGVDSAMMGYRERRCRTDFNTQISVPIAQKMLDLLRLHRPTRLYSYEELFPDVKPADYLLDFFAHHFGFRFEELNWRYDQRETENIVKATMEPLMKQLALVLYTQHCDIIVLAGRPTSLDAINELFIKYIPTSPEKLIRLNDYRVGNFFPTADGQGYFYDQKAIVAVGAQVGYLASHEGLPGLCIDFSEMIRKMTSTANYMGVYNSHRRQVDITSLSPQKSVATFEFSVFPAFIGCRQLDSSIYQARPIYGIYNNSNRSTLRITVSRNFFDSKEILTVEEVADMEGNTLPKSSVTLMEQSLVDDGKYWLDKGEFELSIK